MKINSFFRGEQDNWLDVSPNCNTYALKFMSDGTVKSTRTPFGAFTIEDLKRIGLYDRVFSGD